MLCQALSNGFRGEPGGWMLQDGPESKTHKGTPGSVEDIKNYMVLKFTESGILEAFPIDEVFTFRRTVQHKVLSIEEAEKLMTSKRKSRGALAPQIEAMAPQEGLDCVF